jgi:2-polyprenyl-3-methyl-5-hydroxy-6-metoxy-1,4-benzoquinol methylase
MKVIDKNPFIKEKVRGKSVADLGCVCHDLSEGQIKDGIWLHGEIKETAKSLVGFDIEKEEIAKLQKQGYNIQYCNIEEVSKYTTDKYDSIVMGSVIEHLPNTGLVLESVRKLAHNDSEIIITTINAWAPRYFISAFFNKEERTCRPDHVTWYSHYVIENLVKMYGFKITEKYYYNFYPLKINGIRPFFRVLSKRLFPFTSHGLMIVMKVAQ